MYKRAQIKLPLYLYIIKRNVNEWINRLREVEGGVGVQPVALIPVRHRIDGAGEIEECRVRRFWPIQRREIAAARPGIQGYRLIYEPWPDHLRRRRRRCCLLLWVRLVREVER